MNLLIEKIIKRNQVLGFKLNFQDSRRQLQQQCVACCAAGHVVRLTASGFNSFSDLPISRSHVTAREYNCCTARSWYEFPSRSLAALTTPYRSMMSLSTIPIFNFPRFLSTSLISVTSPTAMAEGLPECLRRCCAFFVFLKRSWPCNFPPNRRERHSHWFSCGAAYGRTNRDVIIKANISRIDRLPYFLTHARAFFARNSAKILPLFSALLKQL